MDGNKDIKFLVPDMMEVLRKGLPSVEMDTLTTFGVNVTRNLSATLTEKEARERPKERHLYASEIGHPCTKNLWYKSVKYWKGSPYDGANTGPTNFKFLYGNMIEEAALAVAEAAGHQVSHRQSRIDLAFADGVTISGKMDAVIDGAIVDVKSIQHQGFTRIGDTYTDDKFGYNGQLAAYQWAAKMTGIKGDDGHFIHGKLPTYFLFVSKQSGAMLLAEPRPFNLPNMLREYTTTCNLDEPAMPRLGDVLQDNGNRKLGTVCSYCPFKVECWPGLRAFIYSTGPEYLTHVTKTPRVAEVPLETHADPGAVPF